MNNLPPDELQELGLAAARRAAGEDAIERVFVEDTIDSLDRPAYRFTYLLDEKRSKHDLGLTRIRIIQALLDDLDARGDEHRPRIVLLDREAWDRRQIGA